MNFSDPFSTPQLVGYIAFLAAIIAFQQRGRRGILMGWFVANTVFAIHYGLMGAYAGAGVVTIAAIRTLTFMQRGKQAWANSIWHLLFFLSATVLATVFTYTSTLSLVICVGGILAAVADWQLNPKRLRLLSLGSISIWLAYSFLIGSIGGTIADVFILTSLLIGIYRYDVRGHTLKADVQNATHHTKTPF